MYTRLSKRIQNCLLPKFTTNIQVCIIRSKNKNRELDSRFLKRILLIILYIFYQTVMQDLLKFLFGSNLCNHQHFVFLIS